VYTSPSPELTYLWRLSVDGNRSPERIEVAGSGAGAVAIARSRDRLVFTRDSWDTDIYRFEVARPARLVIGSTFPESDVRFSSDGRRLAFASMRSGDKFEILVAEADGSGVRQLTHGPGISQGSPSWSPDGRRIVFDSLTTDYHFHVWMIDADGGIPRRLTTQAGDESVPTWSHDGRWIYFSADEGTGRDIWRVPASGRIPQRLTHGARGPFACESADGKSLLFQPQDADAPLMAMDLTAGRIRQLVACVNNSAFGPSPQGVVYVPCNSSSDPPVHVIDLETGRDHRLGTLENLSARPLGLSVSPDGRSIVYPRRTIENKDLMLIENFR
jgi:Tol biopolymer transport system component